MTSPRRHFLLKAHLYIAVFATFVTTNVPGFLASFVAANVVPFAVPDAHAEPAPQAPFDGALPGGAAYLISAFLGSSGDATFVMIDGGRRHGVVEGSVFRAYRRAPAQAGKGREATWAETGRLKAVKVEDAVTYAQVLSEAGPFTAHLFPKYPKLMAGDWASLERVTVSRQQQLTATRDVPYMDLFEDPKAHPSTYELSAKGRALMAELARGYAPLRLSILLIQGFTDAKGSSEANQVESYQRAFAIRQHLVSEWGFDPERVVAIGLGETEPKGEPFAPGAAEANRRIVFKAKALPADAGLSDPAKEW